MTSSRRRIHPGERGVRILFGKRYMWLLNEHGVLGLHKVDDRGEGKGMEALELKQQEQSE